MVAKMLGSVERVNTVAVSLVGTRHTLYLRTLPMGDPPPKALIDVIAH